VILASINTVIAQGGHRRGYELVNDGENSAERIMLSPTQTA